MYVPARTIALLTNPTAGNGRAVRSANAAALRLREAGLRVRELQGKDAKQASTLAREAVDGGVDALVVCGGDGMVHLACQVLAQSGVPLGVIPAGTGNDLARALNLPRADPLAAADRVIAGRVRSIDLALAGDRYFVTVLAAGFDAAVSARADEMSWPRGRARYTLATLAELRTFRPRSYELSLDGRPLATEAMLVAVGNSQSFGGGLRITEGAEIDDGLLDVVVIGPMSRLELVRTYPKLYRGTHTGHPQYSSHRVRSVTLKSPNSLGSLGNPGITAYADGERLAPLPLTIESVPGALGVYQ